MHIFDAHLDLALNGVDWNRDLREPVDAIRNEEIRLGMQSQAGRCTNTVSLPELRRAEVQTCLATLLARQEDAINHDFGWKTEHACYAIAHSHLAYYRALEKTGHLRILTTASDLAAHVRDVESGATAPLGCILAMEGADPLVTPDTLDEFFEAGLRSLGLTHYGDNRYGGGTNSRLGLKPEAKLILERMDSLGMTLDLTHLSDAAFPEALDWFGGRVHASHQNSKRLADWQRQFSDAQYRAVIERDGVVGIALDIIMLQDGYIRGESERLATLETVVDNIDIVCQLSGDTKHVGIGSDLDGAYGCEQTPRDLDRIGDLQSLPELLDKRGYDRQAISDILHGNWLRFFDAVLS